MTDSDNAVVALVFFLAIAAFAMGCMLGNFLGSNYERSVAVKAGVGRHAADPKTGQVRFVYGAHK